MEKKLIQNQSFGQERALYGERDIRCERVAIDGKEDGESAFKECRNVECVDCFSICAIRSGTTTISKSSRAK